MKGVSNRYTLSIVDEFETIVLAKGSLEAIDEITVGFKNRQEFIKQIKTTFDIALDSEKVRIEITYNQTQSNRTIKILYFADKEAMDKRIVGSNLLRYCNNKDFVSQFVNRYKNTTYLNNLSKQVLSAIESDKDYTDALQRIIEIVFKSYKSTRDVYFFIKKYNILSEKETEYIPQLDRNEYKITALKALKDSYQPQISMFNWMMDQSNGDLPGEVKTKKL